MIDNQRIFRVGSVIKKELAQIISNDINDPRIKDVIITDVDISKDLKMLKSTLLFLIIKIKKLMKLIVIKTINFQNFISKRNYLIIQT